MKPGLRSRGDEEEGNNKNNLACGYDYVNKLALNNSSKDWSIGLLKVVSWLVIFMAGTVFGLLVSANFSRYVSDSSYQLFFPPNLYTADCDTVSCSNLRGFVNPKKLIHQMTDEELLWRSSMVPKKMEYPFKRVPKVAFMFLTKGPLPFAPLWDRFFKGHEEFFSVYVHAMPNYKLNASVTSAFYGRQIPSQAVEWGSISLADAEKRLLANALLDFSNERFVLLSESCIPIYDFTTVYKYLTQSVDSFADSFDDPSRNGRGRYSRHMWPDIKLYQWRKGSQWFELNRELAVNIISDTKYYTIFQKYCKPSCYPDEHYIPTYLNMFYGSLNSNRSVTWVDWSRGGPHPAMFGASDVTEDFIRTIRNNGTICTYNARPTSLCYLFARKFAPSALEPLLNLTSTVLKF
ncbi:hypothetical protein QJS04_geneDACA009946 [Acorus gramineus]|uniref:Uncharacterized protein n=1 Tax=Acorus gramineus TaxID=55184 RepID=A0AAV9BHK1_ACOGR|nr:hypothetical protein QJS04_geneDACA009946 [Acorus gramineus]